MKKKLEDEQASAEISKPDDDSDGLASRIVVGLMVTDRDDYYNALKAQADTWLKSIPPRRKFVVGPIDIRHPERRGVYPRFVPSPCGDRELWCKRVEHVVEAGRLLEQGVEFDWLWSGNEDWYVDVEALVDSLKHRSRGPYEAVIYSGLGCSQWWEYHKDSKNNTLSKPPHWPAAPSCQTVKERGGICGGNGIIFSRKSVDIMTKDGGDALIERTLKEPFPWMNHPQGDPVLSCVVYSFNGEIEFEDIMWNFSSDGAALETKIKPKNKMADCPRCRVATVHAVKQESLSAADIIYKAHNLLTAVTQK